ncbi:PREDICTED: 7-deoxyloganetin glucosyltransferase-like [Ipomoea nil]|uniref:7-deoxyloganetin glucosyltransferase-like n=1 Tax=Ipomoea nil TaxID=35883 RepID=UPI000901EEB7|nr:PREDICTED: 7-deoxyloganetin glucosyltransferase-like [Ipomoea nil]
MAHLKKPHVICIPLPAQGHINPIFKLAKLLHSSGFYITFVHTHFNYHRLLKSQDPATLAGCGVADFRFETISDGLPESCQRGILDLPDLVVSLPTHGLSSFRDLVKRLNAAACPEVPPVSCIISDGVMSFTLEVAQEFGIPEFLFFTPSACGMLGYFQFAELVERGYFPLKDESCLSNGFLDTKVDWVAAMEGARLKHLPTFCRSTNPADPMFNYNKLQISNLMKTRTLILNTFNDLEQQFLDAIRLKIPNIYTIGPLSKLQQQFSAKLGSSVDSSSSLWEEDDKFLEWLDKREPRSVVYVNYGSLVTMKPQQLSEFAWGLANSKYPFLWVIRPDLVEGGTEVISNDFLEEIKDRGLLLRWCPQEEVLRHGSVGGFLTHCGWNSTLESISEGVPMICWPFFAEQQMNCFYLCNKWGIGMEIGSDVKREQVEGVLRELMEGEKGEGMREKAMEWKRKVEKATKPGGSSYNNFEMLVTQLKSYATY